MEKFPHRAGLTTNLARCGREPHPCSVAQVRPQAKYCYRLCAVFFLKTNSVALPEAEMPVHPPKHK